MPEPEPEPYVLANDVMVGGVGWGSASLQPCLIPKIDDLQLFFKKFLRRHDFKHLEPKGGRTFVDMVASTQELRKFRNH